MLGLRKVKKSLDDLYEPEPGREFGSERPLYTIDQQFQIKLVGLIALFLPLGAIISTLFGWTCAYGSVSHYYYSPFFGPLFVACLSAISVFMLSYRGESWAENTFTVIGAIAAFLVGWIPTTGSGCQSPEFVSRIFGQVKTVSDGTSTTIMPLAGGGYFEVSPSAGMLHYGAAFVLLVFLTWYALVVFPRPIRKYNGHPPTDEDIRKKKIRNRIYALSGIVMIASLAGILLGKLGYIDTIAGRDYLFVFECTALIAFGVSWSVKGRLFGILMDSRDKAARKLAIEQMKK